MVQRNFAGQGENMIHASANALVAIVAAVLAMIALVEMLFWNKPRVHQRLGFTDSEAKKVAPIVANAGLYNAFIAAGLALTLYLPGDNTAATIFLLSCVVIAGIFGAITLKWTTLVLQTAPGLAALALVMLARG